MNEAPLAFLALVFLVAGLVKGVIGMGLPTVVVALGGLVLAPAHAAALMLVPSLATNVAQAFAGGHLAALARRLGIFLAALCAGTWLAGIAFAGLDDPRPASAALGAALMAYAAYGLLATPLRTPAPLERWLSPAIGALTGAVSGLTGVFVMPSVPYLQALGLAKDELVQALGLTFTVATLALAGALARTGHLDAGILSLSALAALPAFAGMALGRALRARVSQRAFRACFLIGMFALGLHLALRALR